MKKAKPAQYQKPEKIARELVDKTIELSSKQQEI
jgi:hypothetical protein